MTEFKSPDYKTPACESAKGNVTSDTMVYVLTGNEAVGDIVKLRKMSANNSYKAMRLVVSAAMAAAATVKVGYLTREADGTDAEDAFGTGLDVNGTLVHDLIAGAPVPVGEEHDLCIELTTDPAADGAKSYTLVADFVNTAG